MKERDIKDIMSQMLDILWLSSYLHSSSRIVWWSKYRGSTVYIRYEETICRQSIRASGEGHLHFVGWNHDEINPSMVSAMRKLMHKRIGKKVPLDLMKDLEVASGLRIDVFRRTWNEDHRQFLVSQIHTSTQRYDCTQDCHPRTRSRRLGHSQYHRINDVIRKSVPMQVSKLMCL